jgi:hypothetical protein
MTEGRMTKAERDDLVRLIKQREKVGKTAAEQRSAVMLADFEREMAALHPFDSNEVWEAAWRAGAEAAQDAMKKVAEEATRLGIPKEFQPRLSVHWQERGDNAFKLRRAELRKVAQAEIEAMEKTARVQIEAQSVQAQTEVIANGLTSAAAVTFLESLPAIETMMPALNPVEIQRKLAERAREAGRGPYLVEG